MTNNNLPAFLEEWGAKPFHADDVDRFGVKDNDYRYTPKEKVALWQAQGLIERCKPPTGQSWRKYYLKLV